MANYRTENLLSRLGIGVLNGYLMNRERGQQQEDLASERAYELNRDKENREFQTERDTTQREFLTSQKEDERTYEQGTDTKKFRRDLASIAAGLGAFTPEYVDGTDLSKEEIALLEKISSGAQSERASREKIAGIRHSGSDKERSGLVVPGNINLSDRPRVQNPDGTFSTLRSISFQDRDGLETLIPTISPDGQLLSDQDAIALYQSSGQHLGKFSDTESANRAASAISSWQGRTNSGRNYELRDKILRGIEKENSDRLTFLGTIGVPVSKLLDYMEGDTDNPPQKFEEAERHATADHYTSKILEMPEFQGVQPNSQINLKVINETLRRNNLQAIPGDTMSLTGLIDEMISKNVGAHDRKSQFDAIVKLLLEAMSPPQSGAGKQSSGLARGILNLSTRISAGMTPGVSYEDLTKGRNLQIPPGESPGVSPTLENRSIQGLRKQ